MPPIERSDSLSLIGNTRVGGNTWRKKLPLGRFFRYFFDYIFCHTNYKLSRFCSLLSECKIEDPQFDILNQIGTNYYSVSFQDAIS